jgi:glycosyltransferase involved in cell wall biosynthesis
MGHKLRFKLERLPKLVQKTDYKQSIALLSSLKARHINASPYDIINLHWICDGFLSVEEIGKIKKPVVWTFHDMWPFCGAEHIILNKDDNRWKTGYDRRNNPEGKKGVDLNRWTWKRKKKSWNCPMNIVTPSNWLGECVKKSALMKRWPVHVIPNPVDIDLFKPIERSGKIEELGISESDSVLLFVTPNNILDKVKGWDLLNNSLKKLKETGDSFTLVIVGENESASDIEFDFPVRWTGFIKDKNRLAELYNMADITLLPSRIENLPQVATEAQSCGCPVVAYKTGGNPDVIHHKSTGYLAAPYSSEDFVKGIRWIMEDKNRYKNISEQARKRAVDLWSEKTVVEKYLQLFSKIT